MLFKCNQQSCSGLDLCSIHLTTIYLYRLTEGSTNHQHQCSYQVNRLILYLYEGVDNNEVSERLSQVLARRLKRIVYVSCSIQLSGIEESTLRITLLERLSTFLSFLVYSNMIIIPYGSITEVLCDRKRLNTYK